MEIETRTFHFPWWKRVLIRWGWIAKPDLGPSLCEGITGIHNGVLIKVVENKGGNDG